MRSKRTKQFRKLLEQLPSDVQELAHEAYRQFLADTSHPGLDFKQVSKKGPTYSACVGIHYRALAVRKVDHWLWFWIGSHAEYDHLLDQLQ
jgi:hypothetical protein